MRRHRPRAAQPGQRLEPVAAATGIPRDGLDAPPILGDILTSAPAHLVEQLLDSFNVQAVYNNDLHQVTIHATLTDATPQAVTGLLAGPRADHNTPPPPAATAPAATTQDDYSHSASDTRVCYAKWRHLSRADA